MTISTKISLFCQALVISEKKIFDVWSNLHNYQNIVKLQFHRKKLKILDNITSKGGLTYQRQEKKKKLKTKEKIAALHQEEVNIYKIHNIITVVLKVKTDIITSIAMSQNCIQRSHFLVLS
jgi:hypothetical protein